MSKLRDNKALRQEARDIILLNNQGAYLTLRERAMSILDAVDRFLDSRAPVNMEAEDEHAGAPCYCRTMSHRVEAFEAQPRETWDEDDGPALWWKFPVKEPPYSGTPLDDDFPDYVTHWTHILTPRAPAAPPDSTATPTKP